MNGYLFLKNASGIGWGQFWFTLNKESLSWRVDKDDDDFVIGEIRLEDVREFISVSGGPTTSEPIFSLDTPDRLYSFRCPSTDMHTVWCDHVVRRLPESCGTNGYTVEAEPLPRLTLLKWILSRPDPVAFREMWGGEDYLKEDELAEMFQTSLNVKIMANELHHLSKEVGVTFEENTSQSYFEVNSFCEMTCWLERAVELVMKLSDLPWETDETNWLVHVPTVEIWQRLCRVSVVPLLRVVAQLSSETSTRLMDATESWNPPHVVTPASFSELLDALEIDYRDWEPREFLFYLALSSEPEFSVEDLIQRFAHVQRAFRVLFTLTLCVQTRNLTTGTTTGDDTMNTNISYGSFGTGSSGDFDNSLPSWPSTMQQSIPINSDPMTRLRFHIENERHQNSIRELEQERVQAAQECEDAETPVGSEGDEYSHVAPHQYPRDATATASSTKGASDTTSHNNNNDAQSSSTANGSTGIAVNNTGQRAGGAQHAQPLLAHSYATGQAAGGNGRYHGGLGKQMQQHQYQDRERRYTEPAQTNDQLGPTTAGSSPSTSPESQYPFKRGFYIPPSQYAASGPITSTSNTAGVSSTAAAGSTVNGGGVDSTSSAVTTATTGAPNNTARTAAANKRPPPRRRSTSAFADVTENAKDDRELKDYVSVLEEQLADEREARQRIEIAYIELENELHVERVASERRMSMGRTTSGNPSGVRSDLSQLSVQGNEATPLLGPDMHKCMRHCVIL